MSKFEPRVSLITLGVKDMKITRKFYEDLGWKAAAPSNENVTFFQGRGVILGLYGHDALAQDAGVDTQTQPNFRGTSLSYNCASETEVDEAFAHALKCGAVEAKKPEKVFWGGYSGYFSDPDGHLWEVAFNPFANFSKEGHLLIEGEV